jgi:hypothetical protein
MTDATFTYAQTSLPTDMMQQAELQQLGQFRAVYKPTHPLKLIAMIIGSLLLMVAVVVLSLYLTNGLFYFCLLAPIYIIFAAVCKLLKGNRCVYLFTNGLAWTRGRGYEMARWEQIESIWRRKGQSQYVSSLTCTLRLKDGRLLKIDDALKGINELAVIVQDRFRSVRLPEVIALYERGKAVTFGKIQIDHQGINNGKELIPWDQLDTLAIREAAVVAQKHGRPLKWSKVKEEETPNLYVLGSLVDYIVKK